MFVALFMALAFSAGAFAQTVSFGLGDTELEAGLNSFNASAKVDLVGFQTEVSLAWGQPMPSIKIAFDRGLTAGEVYLAAALAKLSGKPLTVVLDLYAKNKSKGWGTLAKDLGIKPGSKEFKQLKDSISGSAQKLKKNK